MSTFDWVRIGVVALIICLWFRWLLALTLYALQAYRSGSGWVGIGSLITVEAIGCTVAVGGALAGSSLVYAWLPSVSPSVHIIAQVAGALGASTALTTVYDRFLAGPISGWFLSKEADEDGQVAPAALLGGRSRDHDEPWG